MDQQTQQQTSKIVSASKLPKLPKWPTSRPGPQVTEPPPGQRRVLTRTEQVVEIGYNQETGEPGVPVSARSEPDESIQAVSTEQEKSTQQAKETERVQ